MDYFIMFECITGNIVSIFSSGGTVFYETTKHQEHPRSARKLEPWEIVKYKLLGYI